MNSSETKKEKKKMEVLLARAGEMKAKGETNGADKQEINASASVESGVYNRWEIFYTTRVDCMETENKFPLFLP